MGTLLEKKKILREEMYKLVRPYEVDRLYKYRSFLSEGLEEIFHDRKIYLPYPGQFNDPFDCRPRIILPSSEYKRRRFFAKIVRNREPSATKGRINKLIRSEGGRKLKDPQFVKNLFWEMLNTYGIYSMSEVKDDILMWAHYSDSHTGVCLEFDAQAIETFFWEAFKVTYQKECPPVDAMDLEKQTEFLKALCVKSDHWSYEKERRVIRTEQEGGSGYYKFTPELLKGVILGARIQEESKRKIFEWVKKYPTQINLYQAKLNELEFKLDIVGIE